MPGDYSQDINTNIGIDTGGAVTSVNNLSSSLGRTTEKTAKAVQGLGYMHLALVRIATYTAIFTAVGGLAKLFGDLATLELRLAEVSTLVDLRNKQAAASFYEVRAALLKLDPRLGNAIDLTKGLYEIMSAGVSEPQQAFKLLVVSAKYAKAGLTDLATAASSLTAVMKAYRLPTEMMREVSDRLFASVMEGKYHADELNEALGKIIPTAAAMGVPIGEIVSILAILTQRGLDVKEAATGLNRAMISFLRPTEGSIKMFKRLGWEWGRDAFRALGLTGTLKRLDQTSQRYSNLLPQIFRRQRALRVGFILSGKALEDVERMMQKGNKATEEGGEVNRAYIKINRTVIGELKILQAQLLQTTNKWLKFSESARIGVQGFRYIATAAIQGIEGFIGYGVALGVIRTLLKKTGVTFLSTQATMQKYQIAQDKLKHSSEVYYRHARLRNMQMERKIKLMGRIKGYVIVGALAYVVIKKALNEWEKSSDKAIASLIKQGQKTKELRTQLDFTSTAYRMATGEALNLAKKGMDEGINAAFEKTIKIAGEFNNKWRFSTKLIEDMGRGTTLTAKGMEAFRKDMHSLFEGIKTGSVDVKEFNALLLWLSKAWGLQTERIKKVKQELQDYGRIFTSMGNDAEKYFDLLAQLLKGMGIDLKGVKKDALELAEGHKKAFEIADKSYREMTFVLRDLQDAAGAAAMHPRTIAEQFPMDKIKSMYAIIKRFTGDISDLDELVIMRLREMGINVEKIIEKLKKAEPAMRDTFDVKRVLEHQAAIDDWARTFGAKTEELAPTWQKFSQMIAGAVIEWKKRLAIGIADVGAFVEEHRQYIKIMKLNWDRFKHLVAPVYREIVEVWLAALSKGTDKHAKLVEKATKAWETGANDIMKIQTNIAEFENELLGRRYENIVLKTKEENELLSQKFDKQYSLMVQAYGLSWKLGLEYLAKKALLLKKEEKAEEVSVFRRLDVYLKAKKETLDHDYDYVFQRIKVARDMYGEFEDLMKAWGVTNVKILKILRKEWEKYWEEVIKDLGRGQRGLIGWIDGLKAFAQMLSSLVSVFRNLMEALGITEGFLFRVTNALDAVAKGANSAAASLKFMQEAKEWGQGEGGNALLSTLGQVAGAISLVVTIATTAISVFKALFGGKSKEQKAAEAARQAEERLKQAIDGVIRSLQHLGKVSESTAEEIYELAKEVGHTNAVFMRLSNIMKDTGVNTKNFTKYIDMMRHMIERAKKGLMDMADFVKSFGSAFSEILKAAQELGLEGSRAMRKLILEALEAGVYIKELYDYLESKLFKAAQGLHAMILNVAKGATDIVEKLRDLKKERREVLKNMEQARKAVEKQANLDLKEIIRLKKKLALLKEGTKEYEKIFNQILLLETRGSKEYRKLVKELEKYRKQLSKIDMEMGEYMKMIHDIAVASRKELKRLGLIAVGTFGAMLKAGVPMLEAMKAMKPAIDALLDRYRMLGLKVPDALKPMIKLFRSMRKNEEFYEGLQGLMDLVEGLGDSAMLTGDMFKLLQKQAGQYWKQLITKKKEGGFGFETGEAARMMFPMLQKFWWYAKAYGYKLTKDIRDAIKAAKEAGLKFEKPDIERQLDAFEKLRVSNRNILAGQTDRMVSWLRKINKNLSNLGSAQGGVPYLGHTSLIHAHRGEAILPGNLNDAMRRFFTGRGGGFGGGEGGAGGVAKVNVSIDGQVIYSALAPFIREGARYADFEPDAEGVY